MDRTLFSARDQGNLLPGTLDVLILRAVSLGPLHGYRILQRIGQISGHVLLIEQGALYPGLFQARKAGITEDELGQVRNNRKAKYYELTTAGRKPKGSGGKVIDPPHRAL